MRIGHFDPAMAPFRAQSGNTIGLFGASEADQAIETRIATMALFGNQFGTTEDQAVDHIIDLCGCFGGLSKATSLLRIFEELSRNQALSEFVLATTSMPFFLSHSREQPTVIAEVHREIEFNTIFSLLASDKEFSKLLREAGKRVSELSDRITPMLTNRRAEVDAQKQWAADFRKAHGF